MKKSLLNLALLSLTLPVLAVSDISGTVTLQNQYLNLDTGATGGPYLSGDIYWSDLGSSLELLSVGSARLYPLPIAGQANFASLTLAQLKTYSYTQTALTSPYFTPGNIFAVHTNGDNYAAAIVTATGPGFSSVTFQYTTFITGNPVITQVANNFSFLPPGLPNSGIAQGSLFVIEGTHLSNNATPVLQSSTPGLSTTLNGVSVNLTVDGFQEQSPAFYYAFGTGLAMVMPSTVHTGLGIITVNNNGKTSLPFQFYVVPSAMAFDSYYGPGSGLGVATNIVTGALYNYSNSIPPGSTVTLWGSGLGPDPARDITYTVSPGGFPIAGLSALYIGGVQASILYQGASGFPGVNQLNVTIPANTPTGCNVALVGVNISGAPTNITTLPIGTGPCSDPSLNVDGGLVSSLSAQSTVNTGSVTLSYNNTTDAVSNRVYTAIAASFQQESGGAFGARIGALSPGSCTISESSLYASSPSNTIPLSEGQLAVTGPNGAFNLAAGSGSYSTYLPSGFLTTAGGAFQLSATAGSQVGAFTTQTHFSSPLFTWTNSAPTVTITRSAGWTVTWSGAPAGSFVTIAGYNTAGLSAATGAYFSCLAPAAAGQFTVPSYILEAMPASSGNGFAYVSNVTAPQTFTAPGLDYASVSTSVNITVQANYLQ